MIKHSRQRDAIFDELCQRKDHPTAETLYFKLKSDYPHLSLATVYRNLAQLEAEGRIQRIVGGESVRFDGNASNHPHFVCLKCGAVIDVDIDKSSGEEKLLNFQGTVLNKTVIFSGYCPLCVKAFNESNLQ